MKRKIMIVIEETGGENGKEFDVYLAGDIQGLESLSADKASPAQFWGRTLWGVCMEVLTQAGVVKHTGAKPKAKEEPSTAIMVGRGPKVQ